MTLFVQELAKNWDNRLLHEEFVAEFLRRHKSRSRLGNGRRLAPVSYQCRLMASGKVWVE